MAPSPTLSCSKDIKYSSISDRKAAPRDAEPPPREHNTKALFLERPIRCAGTEHAPNAGAAKPHHLVRNRRSVSAIRQALFLKRPGTLSNKEEKPLRGRGKPPRGRGKAPGTLSNKEEKQFRGRGKPPRGRGKTQSHCHFDEGWLVSSSSFSPSSSSSSPSPSFSFSDLLVRL